MPTRTSAFPEKRARPFGRGASFANVPVPGKCRGSVPVVLDAVPVKTFFDVFGNKVGRIVDPGGRFRIWSNNTVRDTGMPDAIPQSAADRFQASPADLPAEVLQYLMCSRYCELELLQDRVWSLFGHLAPGWNRARAVVDWVHQHMTFGYQYARHTRTAVEALNEACGVCRDFQHLCVAFHRCLNLPARYVTGYLGDIGIPANPA